jgi:uncharacterized protein YaiL (DUF2058 family)
MPLTEFYTQKFVAGATSNQSAEHQESTVIAFSSQEGENQIMMMAQKQMLERHQQLAQSYKVRYEFAQTSTANNRFVQQLEKDKILSEQALKARLDYNSNFASMLSREESKVSAAFGKRESAMSKVSSG